MASYEDAIKALRNADAAGDREAATRLARIVNNLRNAPKTEQPKEPSSLMGEVSKGFKREAFEQEGGLVGGAVGALTAGVSYGAGKLGETVGEGYKKIAEVSGASPETASKVGKVMSFVPDVVLGGGVGKAVGKEVAAPIAEHLMAKSIGAESRNLSVREAEQLTKTALENGINVTKGGVQKLRGMIRDLGSKVDSVISTSSAKIAQKDILQDLKSPAARSEFRRLRMAYKGRDIPIKALQEEKQMISRRLSDYQYKDIQLGGKSEKVEGMQELQRVLREKIAKLEPSVAEPNQKMHELYNLRPHLEKRVVRNMQKWVGTAPTSIGARTTQALGSTTGAATGATAGALGQEALSAPSDR